MSIFLFSEHDGLCDELQRAEFNDLMSLGSCPKLPSKTPKVNSVKDVNHLGLFRENDAPKAHYYIGASWLIKEKHALVVMPKVDVDYISLFMTAMEMNSEKESTYFSNYYHIDFEEPAIKTEALNNVLTPLLILHYLSLLKHLVSRGLKKGYVIKEENLQSKIRGRFLLQKHLMKNVFAKREDRAFCRYQEFTEDIPENRILKKALSFSMRFISCFESFKPHMSDLTPSLSILKAAFEGVSEDVTIAQVTKINAGKIYRHYEAAIKTAKLILRHFDYSIDNASEKVQQVRPFCIDMPRLYEMYVLSLLRKAYPNRIQFQVKGSHKTQVDYIKTDEKIIIDAKYKPRYNDGNAGIMEDIREISGYARDEKILKALDWKPDVGCINGDYLPKCVIVYPDKSAKFEPEDGCTDVECEEISSFEPAGILKDSRIKQIPGFRGFYKIAVPLPAKKVD